MKRIHRALPRFNRHVQDQMTDDVLRMLLSGDATTALRWLETMPRERIENDIDLLLIRAVSRIADYQFVQAADDVRIAEALLKFDSPQGQRGAWLAVRGTLRRMMAHPDESTSDLEEARELVEPDTFWSALVSFQLGMSPMLGADADGLIKSLAKARLRHSRPEDMMLAVLAQTHTAYAESWRGDPERALVLAKEMAPWIDVTDTVTAGRPLGAFPNTVQAEAYLMWNDLDPARMYAEKAVEHGRRGLTMGLFDATCALARVAEAQRDWETAMRAAADAAIAIRHAGGHRRWSWSVEALAHRILWRRGQVTGNRADIQAVERWVVSNRIEETLMPWEVRRIAGLHCDAPLLLAARVRIEKEAWDAALLILGEVLLRAIYTSRVMTQVEALILRSVVKTRQGPPPEDVPAMLRALNLATRARIIRPFADEGAAILPLVEQVAASAENDFAARVLAAFAPPGTAPATGTPEPLSERELEILRIAGAGASNQDVADRLSLSSHTVKKHLENVYAKLRVNGREEAIARARYLNFL